MAQWQAIALASARLRAPLISSARPCDGARPSSGDPAERATATLIGEALPSHGPRSSSVQLFVTRSSRRPVTSSRSCCRERPAPAPEITTPPKRKAFPGVEFIHHGRPGDGEWKEQARRLGSVKMRRVLKRPSPLDDVLNRSFGRFSAFFALCDRAVSCSLCARWWVVLDGEVCGVYRGGRPQPRTGRSVSGSDRVEWRSGAHK